MHQMHYDIKDKQRHIGHKLCINYARKKTIKLNTNLVINCVTKN